MTDVMYEVGELVIDVIESSPKVSEVMAEEVLKALFQPRVVVCNACGGLGQILVDDPTQLDPPCHADGCVDGQVTRPSLAILRGELEQVEYVKVERIVLDGSAQFPRDPLMTRRAGEPLYRIASGEVAP